MSAHETYLADARSFDVDITSGSISIKSGRLHVRPMTAGLGIRHAEASIAKGDIEVQGSSRDAGLKFSKLARNSFARISIPYATERLVEKLSVRLEMEYETEEGKSFSLTRSVTITATLPISVNVQDIFRQDLLLSTYTISPGTTTPIRLLDCHLSSSKTHRVESSAVPGQTSVVFPKQPASIVFKTIPCGSCSNEKSPSTLLEFRADFTLLDDECLHAIEQQFLSDLRSSAFSGYARLLAPYLRRVFTSSWTAGDLEVIGLLGRVELFPFETFQWHTVLQPLDRVTRENITEWLRTWHREHSSFPLPKVSSSCVARKLAIPVSIPEFQVVHTALLQPLDATTSSDSVSSASPSRGPRRFSSVTLGSVLPTSLTISHTRRWCPAANRTPSSALEFTYDVLASPDTWIIGGRRRGNFKTAEGETRSFTVLLVPQRPGHLLLPDINISSAVAAATTSSSDTGNAGLVASEVDYQNRAETVYVTPNHGETTVCLGSGPGGDVTLGA